MQILWNNFLGIGEAVASLLLLIDSTIYWLISELFSLYTVIAQAKIFQSDLYVDIANKVYLIMGVVALFITVYVLLQSIVNPDSLTKNGMDFVKKFVIAIVMIMLTPSIFNLLYKAQDVILGDNVIANVILGNSYESTTVYAAYYLDLDNPDLSAEDLEAKIKNATANGGEYDVSNFQWDEDGSKTTGKVIRYFVNEECSKKYPDYATQMEKVTDGDPLCYKLTYNDNTHSAANNNLIKRYGNYMSFSVLEAFLHPSSGRSDSDVVVNAVSAVGLDEGKSTTFWATCAAAGGVAAIISIAVPGIGWAGGVALTAAACGTAGYAGSEIYEGVNYEYYDWSDAKRDMLLEGNFNVITAFAGDSEEGIISGEMSYTPIVSTICGLVLLYMIFGYCLDLGLRAAKLAFYQMLAPVSFMLDVLPGQKGLLSNWLKAVLTTWGEVFVRLFTMFAVVYLFSKLDMLAFESMDGGLVAKAIVAMGLVMFVKQFPKLLGDITGIKSENMKLGIMEKLGAGGALAAGALIGGGLTAGVKNFTNSWRNNKGKGFKRFTSAAGSAFAGTVSGGVRSAKAAGFKAKSWGDLRNAASTGSSAAHTKSKDRAAYKASHGGTLGGVIAGHAKDAWSGVKNWAGANGDILDIVQYEDDFISGFDDYSAIYSNGAYNAMDAQLNQLEARIASEGAGAETYAGSGITLQAARDQLKEQMRYKRLRAISDNTDSAAYAAYNISRQVQKDPNTASRAGVSSEFIRNADDFVLRNNKVYHRNGSLWTADELHRLFEGKRVTSVDANGNITGDTDSNIYGTFEGLSKSKGTVRKQRTQDKNSIAYKEAKKTVDSAKTKK